MRFGCPPHEEESGSAPESRVEGLRESLRIADERAGSEHTNRVLAEMRVATLEEFLQGMLDPEWWREEVDVNGEYTTTRARGYYEVAPQIRAALSTEAGNPLTPEHPPLCAIWVELDDVEAALHPVGNCDCGISGPRSSLHDSRPGGPVPEREG